VGEPAARTVSIPGRFNGPPSSANGGYTCGTVARLVGGRAAAVMLRRPPPLDRPLAVEGPAATDPGEGGVAEGQDVGAAAVRLLDGDAVVAEGRHLEALDAEPPGTVSQEEAREAMAGFPWYDGHPFPTCFVCGPERDEHDGLRIFAGAVAEEDVFACPWTPSSEWADGGAVRTEVVWAALDCPSAVAAAAGTGADAPAAVLARLSASIDAPVPAEEPHVVVSWPLGREGRKRFAGSAIVGTDGAVRARASALWIELRD
jgi:hypothetical protein